MTAGSFILGRMQRYDRICNIKKKKKTERYTGVNSSAVVTGTPPLKSGHFAIKFKKDETAVRDVKCTPQT